MEAKLSRLVAVLIFCFLLVRCGSGGTDPTVPGDPVAVITVLSESTEIELGASVDLDASQSRLGENTEGWALSLSYFWELDSSPTASLLVDESLVQLTDADDEPDPTKVSFTPDVQGLYGITLQVGDGERLSDVDHLVIQVGGGNSCPEADAGEDIAAETGVPVSLDGTGSVDVDIPEETEGDDDDDDGGEAEEGVQELTFTWHLSLTPASSVLSDADIYHQGSATPVIIPDAPGTYILQLRVDDGLCTSLPDYVTVQASSANQAPIADAGPSIVLTPCSPTQVSLDGTASYDPEGQPLNYEWTFTSVPNGSGVGDAFLDGRYTVNPKFNWDIPGIYTLELTVADSELSSPPDYVAVQAVPGLPNETPVAYAGEDVVLNATAACTTSQYVTTCNPCGARSVVVDAGGSWDPDGDFLNYQWEQLSGSATLLGIESVSLEVEFPELNVSPGATSTLQIEIGLTVFDCRAADGDSVVITFICNG